jgi:hypothetical protein
MAARATMDADKSDLLVVRLSPPLSGASCPF